MRFHLTFFVTAGGRSALPGNEPGSDGVVRDMSPDGPQLESNPYQDGDEEPPPSGGVFRRIAPGRLGSAFAFSIFEEIYAPAHRQARDEIEEQRRVGRPAPAPTDPPDLPDPTVPGAQDPVPGRSRKHFGGRVVIRRNGAGTPPPE